MKTIEEKTFDKERALYGSEKIKVRRCAFDGPADGESPLKESQDIQVEDCFFNLRYPFWHDDRVKISGSELTDSAVRLCGMQRTSRSQTASSMGSRRCGNAAG